MASGSALKSTSLASTLQGVPLPIQPTLGSRNSPPGSSSSEASSSPKINSSSSFLRPLDRYPERGQSGATPPDGGKLGPGESNSEEAGDARDDGSLGAGAAGEAGVAGGEEGNPSRASGRRHKRPPKGLRARVKRFLSHAEHIIWRQPNTSLDAIEVPPFIAADQKAHGGVMQKLAEFQAQVLNGGNPVPLALQPRRSKHRLISSAAPGMQPEAKRLAGPLDSPGAAASSAAGPSTGPHVGPQG
mmetsp:Transcript_50817/g.157418  ORF Transcript_50817/g.157418 Transcript_50817/m.157418 type:complete len:244 (+) Transcript_50817:60-791(+)